MMGAIREKPEGHDEVMRGLLQDFRKRYSNLTKREEFYKLNEIEETAFCLGDKKTVRIVSALKQEFYVDEQRDLDEARAETKRLREEKGAVEVKRRVGNRLRAIGVDVRSGKLSVIEAYEAIKNLCSDLEIGGTTPFLVEGLLLSEWVFVVALVKALQEGRVTKEEVEERLCERKYDFLRGKVIMA